MRNLAFKRNNKKIPCSRSWVKNGTKLAGRSDRTSQLVCIYSEIVAHVQWKVPVTPGTFGGLDGDGKAYKTVSSHELLKCVDVLALQTYV